MEFSKVNETYSKYKNNADSLVKDIANLEKSISELQSKLGDLNSDQEKLAQQVCS